MILDRLAARAGLSFQKEKKWQAEARRVVRQPNASWESGPERREEYKELTDAVIEAFDAAFCKLEDPEVEIDLRNSLSICELHFERPVKTTCCGIGTNMIVIQDDGNLASCPMTTR